MAIFSTIGSIIAGDKQSDAIDDASDAQAQAQREALQFMREGRDQNVLLQTPWMNTGLAANAQMNALLGLNVPNTPAPSLPSTSTGSNTGGSSGSNLPLGGAALLQVWQRKLTNGEVEPEQLPAWVQQRLGIQQVTTQPVGQPVPVVNQPTAQQAFDQFKNYTGYTSRLNEANNAMNSAYAAKGTLQSGAALQALSRMNQDYASNEFGKYMGYLGGQQQVGVGATNALSGVTTNYGNNAANLAMNQGNNLANAAIAQGNVQGNMWNNIFGGLGGIAGSMFGSSYGG